MEKFKVGDVVYDEVNYPNEVFKVASINGNLIGYPIIISNESTESSYTNDGRYNRYKQPTLSHTPYTIEFKGFSQERPKVLTDEQKICIKSDGTMEYGKKIIEYLKSLGGINIRMNGNYYNYFYYITSDFSIDLMEYIPEGYKEITLKDEVKREQVCYVGKKIEYNEYTCLILNKDYDCIEFICGSQIMHIKISDIINGTYKIIDVH